MSVIRDEAEVEILEEIRTDQKCCIKDLLVKVENSGKRLKNYLQCLDEVSDMNEETFKDSIYFTGNY